MITLQKDDSQVFERDIAAGETGRKPGEDLHLKGTEKTLTIAIFLRKGKLGA